MCDWPTARGTSCELSSRPFSQFGLDLCSKHADKLVRAVVSELARNAYRETGYGPQVLAALMHYATEHRAPAPEFWAWVYEMEGIRLRREPKEPAPPTWVYFAEREGFVKIGWSANVAKRVSDLAAGGQMPEGMTAGPLTLLATMPGGRPEERALHDRFDHLRLDPRREWFLFDGDLVQFLAELGA